MAVSIQMKSFPPAAGFFSWLIWGQLKDLGLAFTASPPVPWPWEGMIGGDLPLSRMVNRAEETLVV